MSDKRKYKKGDRVLYQGLIGIVQELTETTYGVPTVALMSEENNDLTCTAREIECEEIPEDLDQTEGLRSAYYGTKRIENMVDGLTDKHFRDGNH